MVNWIPLGRSRLVHGDLHIEGVSAVPKGYGVDKLVIAPGYFSTMGIRLFAGRDFDSRDNQSSLPVTIVSRSVARRFWPPDGLGAIGQRLTENGEIRSRRLADDRRHRRRCRAAGRDAMGATARSTFRWRRLKWSRSSATSSSWCARREPRRT